MWSEQRLLRALIEANLLDFKDQAASILLVEKCSG
jgi:hypothetical protein